MNPPGGGEVQGKLSAVAFLSLLRAKADQAGGEDLADLGEPLGGGHQVGVESVVQIAISADGMTPRISVGG
jgi:hypothetical protein